MLGERLAYLRRKESISQKELGEKLTALRCAADDAAECVRDFADEFAFSPEELDQLEGRLDVIYRLKKKYGPTVADMLDYLEKCRAELEQIQDADDTIQKLEKELSKARTESQKRGGELSKARRKAADNLQKRVQEELRQLDMPKVQFVTEFAPNPGQDGMDDTGMDQVQFLMSANLGEALKPIQKVASGGELARIMLALKNVLAEDDGIGSLVFDEVDTGVSGRAAQKVAEKMADVARRKQVLCVTHLPQIAAMADTHFSVEKGEKNEYGQFMHFRTLTWVPVDREAVDERYLTETQKAYLHSYQREVYEKLSPYLDQEEREWLRGETLGEE